MYLKKNYTPEKIYRLEENQIFVFGSNTEGRHGKGAAKYAKDKFGAIQGQPYGIQGQSYAIITKELRKWKPQITEAHVAHQIKLFFQFAIKNLTLEFLVTKIGTGLGGFKTHQMRSLFRNEISNSGLPNNVLLPKEFIFDSK